MRICHNFAGLGIADFHSMVPIVRKMRLRLPAKFFQPFSHLFAARFANIAMFTVRMAYFQKGQQGAHPDSEVHDLPLWILGVLFLNWRENEGGEKENPALESANYWPVPVNATACEVAGAATVTFKVAGLAPLVVGRNVTLIVQFAPTASVPGQLLFWLY
jgi:hypothetical protein